MSFARVWTIAICAISLVLAQGKNGLGQARQEAKSFQKEITRTVKLNYLLYLPEGYENSDKKFPLLVFLHGAGETGTNLEMVKKHGPPKLIESKKDFPFIVVSPQAPRFGWDPEAVIALVDEVQAKYRVDPDRVYLTGLSMGGYGTWETAGRYPERFAAIAPICGGGSRSLAARLRDMPVWVFHGAKDAVVPLEESQRMVDALKARGGGKNVRFTIYPEAGHDSWTEAYNNDQLYEWMLQHQRRPLKKKANQ